jgi:hypothetical protein
LLYVEEASSMHYFQGQFFLAAGKRVPSASFVVNKTQKWMSLEIPSVSKVTVGLILEQLVTSTVYAQSFTGRDKAWCGSLRGQVVFGSQHWSYLHLRLKRRLESCSAARPRRSWLRRKILIVYSHQLLNPYSLKSTPLGGYFL